VRWVAWLAVTCACGRLRFDPQPGDASRDSATISDGALPDTLMPITFGDTTVEGQGPDQHPTGLAEASSYYATQAGAVDQLVIWYDGRANGDNATALIAGLYTDNGAGNPETLLASGIVQPGALTKQTWYRIQVAQTAIAANTFYWIAAACPVGAGTLCSFEYKYYGATGAGPCTPTPTVQCTQHSSQSNLVTMPASWTSGTIYLPSINSYYATHD
jgi:hypothetical protein